MKAIKCSTSTLKMISGLMGLTIGVADFIEEQYSMEGLALATMGLAFFLEGMRDMCKSFCHEDDNDNEKLITLIKKLDVVKDLHRDTLVDLKYDIDQHEYDIERLFGLIKQERLDVPANSERTKSYFGLFANSSLENSSESELKPLLRQTA